MILRLSVVFPRIWHSTYQQHQSFLIRPRADFPLRMGLGGLDGGGLDHAWLYSRANAWFCTRGHSQWCLGGHMQCWRSQQGWSHARQNPPLHYFYGPRVTFSCLFWIFLFVGVLSIYLLSCFLHYFVLLRLFLQPLTGSEFYYLGFQYLIYMPHPNVELQLQLSSKHQISLCVCLLNISSIGN